ncbi:MAG: PHB depolymerase family esterase [Bacteriovorax sp.]|nr:PHB depolymerase family esterase [Bacteriovorax sp.]
MNTRIAIFISSLLLTLSFSSAISAADVFESGSYQGIFGARNYKVYIPKTLAKNKKAPVVVMIHGCQQDAAEFAAGTRITKWADKEQFIVLLPEQNIAWNPYKCWNWVLPVNNARTGETQVIIEMLDAVLEKYHGDKDKVFAAGMSSGASMVNILGNCYPERFKALGSHDGTQYYATATGLDFADVVLYGAANAPWVAASYGNECSAYTSGRPKKMPIIIFHGMNGPLMSPAHAFQIESEFKILNDYLDNGKRDTSYFLEKSVVFTPATTTYGYNKFTLVNKQHEELIVRYMINDLAHSWSGGDASLPYNDAKGPDATALIIDFFKKYGL